MSAFKFPVEVEELIKDTLSDIDSSNKTEVDEALDTIFKSSEYRRIGLSKKENAFIYIDYPKTSDYLDNVISFGELLGLKATLVSIGNVKNKEDLIGMKKRLDEWKHYFSDSQIYKLTFE